MYSIVYKVESTNISDTYNDIIRTMIYNTNIPVILELLTNFIIIGRMIYPLSDQNAINVVLTAVSLGSFLDEIGFNDTKLVSISDNFHPISINNNLFKMYVRISPIPHEFGRFYRSYISEINIMANKQVIETLSGDTICNLFDTCISDIVSHDFESLSEINCGRVEFINHMVALECDEITRLMSISFPYKFNDIILNELSENYIFGTVDTMPKCDNDDMLRNVIPYFYHSPNTLYYVQNIQNLLTISPLIDTPRRDFEISFDTKILKLDNSPISKDISSVNEVIYYTSLYDIDNICHIYKSINERSDECYYCGYYETAHKDEFDEYITKNIGNKKDAIHMLYSTNDKTYFVMKKYRCILFL
jgi:hypothetical protein